MALPVRLNFSISPRHPTPPSPESESLPSLWMCQPLGKALFYQPLDPQTQTHGQVQDLADLQSLYSLPPVEMLKTSLHFAGAGPGRCGDHPAPGVGVPGAGHMASAGNRAGNPRLTCFSAQLHRLALTLEKPWIFGLSPLKWGSGLHANSVP